MARLSFSVLISLVTVSMLLVSSPRVQGASSPLQLRRSNGPYDRGYYVPPPKDGPFTVHFENITDPNSNHGQTDTTIQGQLKEYGLIKAENEFTYFGSKGFSGGFNAHTSDPMTPDTENSEWGGSYLFDTTEVSIAAGIDAFGVNVKFFKVVIDSTGNVTVKVDITGRTGDQLRCAQSAGQDNKKGTLTCTTAPRSFTNSIP